MKQETEMLAALLVAAHRLTRIAARTTGNTTPSALWNTLSILTTDGDLRIGELAAAARVTQPSMTKVVRQLEEEQLVERIADPTDSRAALVRVTPEGIRKLESWRITLATALAPMFEGLNRADRTALTQAVKIITARTATDRIATS